MEIRIRILERQADKILLEAIHPPDQETEIPILVLEQETQGQEQGIILQVKKLAVQLRIQITIQGLTNRFTIKAEI